MGIFLIQIPKFESSYLLDSVLIFFYFNSCITLDGQKNLKETKIFVYIWSNFIKSHNTGDLLLEIKEMTAYRTKICTPLNQIM